ncbi:disease resistance protein Roq1-like [Prosopis cineraria]|uniref:disease resistance protein Roq1-like n=1 Tax=Prosopis cineraria TaxID=364024 RepID=UPI00240FED04|nr:disease resistance protein Roq1-like [Prosopis cineraria]
MTVRGKYFTLSDFHSSIAQQKKILIILDDVDESEQLQELVGRCDWYGCGSREIITARNIQLLYSHGIQTIYDVEKLKTLEARDLLSWSNFKNYMLEVGYFDVSRRALHYSSGIPFALEVIGSYLCGKTMDEWNSALHEMEKYPIETLLCNNRHFMNVEEQLKELAILEEKEPQSCYRGKSLLNMHVEEQLNIVFP